MNKLLLLAGFLVACLFATGCGDKPYSLTKEDRATFKNAAPDVMQLWEEALKADQANDYLNAGNKYRALMAKGITPDQLAAVQTALGGLNIRLNEAAAKGDTAAQKALATAREASPRR